MAAVTIHARNTDYGGPVLWFVDSRRIDEAAMATNKRSSGKDNVQQRSPRTERSAPSKRANEPERPKGRAKIVEPRASTEAELLNEILGIGPTPREPHRGAIQRREVRLHQAREPLLD